MKWERPSRYLAPKLGTQIASIESATYRACFHPTLREVALGTFVGSCDRVQPQKG